MRLISSVIVWYRASVRHRRDPGCCASRAHVADRSRCRMISHDRTADQSHEYLGCNDFFGQGSSTRGRKNPRSLSESSFFFAELILSEVFFNRLLSSSGLFVVFLPVCTFFRSFPPESSSSRALFLGAFDQHLLQGSSSSAPSTAALSPLLFFFATYLVESSSRLQVLLRLFPAAEVSSTPSILQVSPAACRQKRCIFFPYEYFLSTFLISCGCGLGSWVAFLCLLSRLSSFHDQLTFHVRPASLHWRPTTGFEPTTWFLRPRGFSCSSALPSIFSVLRWVFRNNVSY